MNLISWLLDLFRGYAPEPTTHPCGCKYKRVKTGQAYYDYSGPGIDRIDYGIIWVEHTDGKKRDYYPGYRFTYRCHECGDTFTYDYWGKVNDASLGAWEDEPVPEPIQDEVIVDADDAIHPSYSGSSIEYDNIRSGTDTSNPPYEYSSKIEEPPGPIEIRERVVEG